VSALRLYTHDRAPFPKAAFLTSLAGLGLAAHLGLVAEVPTIGVAKSRLAGEGEGPDLEAGSYNALIWKEKQVGGILRIQKGIKPLFVSPGHRITLPECVSRYRLPLPAWQADLLSRRLRA
jgi:deoxyribonuclease V